MGLFSKKDESEKAGGGKLDRNLPAAVFESPTLRVVEGFKNDSTSTEPILRLARYMREQLGLHRGDYVTLKKGDRAIRVKVDVSSAEDGADSIARLNPRSRELLAANIGDEIEIIPAETLILLIDTSGSMLDYISGIQKMEAAKNAVREFIRSKFLMGQGDRIGIVSFGEYANFIETPSDRYEYLENRIGVLMPNGATAMHEGMNLSIENLASRGGAKRIVLLTDGMPTTTGKLAILNLAKKAAEKRIVIDTVGVGTPFDFMSYDELLLRRIAAITGGTFRRVLDVGQLSEEFRSLALGKNYAHLLPEK
jgi:Mg-chelatase subunit ChlD